ncbi:MAG: biopolymer transporter ExbD [Rhodospirillales bacterium]
MAANLINPRRRGRRGYQKMTDINVTPFIDVMLVLLIVFMVTAPLIIAGTQIQLPADTRAAAAAPDDSTIVVRVAADGRISVKNAAIEPALLVGEVARLAGGDMARVVVVLGDRQASYAQVASVLGPLSAAGFTGLALGKTEPQPASPGRKS